MSIATERIPPQVETVGARINLRKFSSEFLRIKTKDQTIAPLKFNGAQIILWRIVKQCLLERKPIRLAILKARQLGISTFCQALLFWWVTTHKYSNALAVAHDTESTTRIFEMTRLFYDYMPIKPMVRYSKKTELVLENPRDVDRPLNPGLRSRLELRTAGTKGAGRGTTIHCLHASEVALWPNADILSSALFPTVPYDPNTIVVLESTAHGAGDWWQGFWEECKAGENGYTPIFIPWHVMEEYTLNEDLAKVFLDSPFSGMERMLQKKYDLTIGQLAWRRMRIRELGSEALFHQEYPSDDVEAWLVSGLPLFDQQKLKAMLLKKEDPHRGYMAPEILFKKDGRGPVYMWEPPVDGSVYVIGVDTSSGAEGGDPSCAQVVKCTSDNFHHVARWHGHIDPIILAHEVEKLARWYNNAIVSIEINYHGIACQMELRNTYFNLYRWRRFDEYVDKPTPKIGWETNIRTKPLIISFMAHLIVEGTIVTHDEKTIKEAMDFVQSTESPGSGKGASGHDDCIMGLMIACYTASREGAGSFIGEVHAVTRADVQRVNEESENEGVYDEDEIDPTKDYRTQYFGVMKRYIKSQKTEEEDVVDWRVI